MTRREGKENMRDNQIIIAAEKRARLRGVEICDAEYCGNEKCVNEHYHIFNCRCVDCIAMFEEDD